MRIAMRLPAALAGLTSSFVVAGYLFQISWAPSHDLAWLLIATGRLLTSPGLDSVGFIDPNPPLILYLLTPPVALSEFLGVSLLACTALYVSALTCVSLLATNHFMKGLIAEESAAARNIFLVFAAFALAIFPGLPITALAFAQREHFMVILLLPYLVVCARENHGRSPSTAEGIFAGLIGGIGAAVKPHYLLCLGVIEVYLAIRRRTPRVWLRPQFIALLGVVFLYACLIALAAPTYLQIALPLFFDVYWAYQRPFLELLNSLDGIALVACIPALWLTRRHRWAFELGAILALAAVSFYAASLLQGTGWRYTVLPMQISVILVLALPVAGSLGSLVPAGAEPLGWRRAVLPTGLGLALGLLGVVGSPTFTGSVIRTGEAWRAGSPSGPVEVSRREIHANASGAGVTFLSTALGWEFSALLYTDAQYCSRFSCLWPLPAIIRARVSGEGVPERLTPDRLNAVENFVRNAVFEDLEACRPALVLVDQQPHKLTYEGLPFDLLAYLSEDARFARLWNDYRLEGHVGRFDMYTRGVSRVDPER